MNESKSFLNFEKQMCSENTVDSVQVVSSYPPSQRLCAPDQLWPIYLYRVSYRPDSVNSTVAKSDFCLKALLF